MPSASPVPEHLLLTLGVGPPNEGPETVRLREYRQTTYARPDTGAHVSTPFVGEAIVRLHPGRFAHVHVFGTADSMWDTLLFHALVGAGADEEDTFAAHAALHDVVNRRTLAGEAAPLRAVERAVGALLGVPVSCHLIPLGLTDAEQWSMLEIVAGLDLPDPARLSIDITHGLRTSPLFLTLAIQYLAAVRPGVSVADAFYGAYELRAHAGLDGHAPLLSLRPFLDLANWLDAAQAFDRSADAGPLARLLGDGQRVLADKALDLTRTLQANALPLLRGGANAFLSALRGVPAGHAPLDLVRPALERLPRQANSGPAWKALLFVADHHAEHGRLGLALLSAWEGARARVAEAYGCGSRPLSWQESAHVDACLKKVSSLTQLRLDRNAVAHASLYASREDNARLKELRGRVGEVLEDVRAVLEGEDIPLLTARHPWESLAPSRTSP